MAALVYIDQNILSAVQDDIFTVEPVDGVEWVYSDEHFKEIARGSDTSYLSALQKLRARQLKVLVDDQWQLTDRAILNEYSCPYKGYDDYLQTIEEVPIDESLFMAPFARLFGADNLDSLLTLPQSFQDQLHELRLGNTEDVNAGSEALKTIIGELRERRSLESLRGELGIAMGRIGNFESNEVICETWKLIEQKCGGVTIDQFFGFNCLDNKEKPIFLGIIGCHTVLNWVGFRTDKRIARSEAVPGMLSDGRHIAHAAFCDLLISEDRRMCDKARAIYQYLDLRTEVGRLDLTGSSRVCGA